MAQRAGENHPARAVIRVRDKVGHWNRDGPSNVFASKERVLRPAPDRTLSGGAGY